VGPEVPSERLGAMQLELSNFQRVAADEAVEQKVPDLGGAEQLPKPMIEESDQGLASLIRSLGMISITDIDNLVSELQDARDYLQSEGERIRAEVAHYAALAGAASASVKIIFDVLRAWRTTGHPAYNQSQASAFEITDASPGPEATGSSRLTLPTRFGRYGARCAGQCPAPCGE
jgi:hypothetical protein